nr:PAS domain S-box protein [Kineococcus aurantiacus]
MCALHFTDGEVVHVPDAALDERFRANPWVDGRLGRVRLYASAPLLDPDGHALGSLCVFDTAPGEVPADRLEALRGLARVVVALFERRRRARVAERLAARDAELRLVLDATSDAFVAVDADQRITSWNGAAERVFGWPAAEALGRTLVETIVPPSAAAAHSAGLTRYLGTGVRHLPGTVEVPARHRDGRELTVELTLTPVEAGGRQRVYAAARDVTDRRRLERELREAQERFSLAFTQAPTGVLLTALTGELAGRFTDTNPAVCAMLGYSREELLGKTFADVTHPGDRDLSREQLRLLVDGEVPSLHFEKRYVRADGEVIWVALDAAVLRDGDGVPRFSVTHVEDVTGKRADRQRLAASEQRFRLAFDTAPVGMLILGLGERDAGRVLQVNSTMRRFTGRTTAELVGREVHDLVHPDEQADILLAFAPFLLGERTHGQLEQRFRHADGTVRWGLVSATAMSTSEDGEPQLLCLVEDVTARKAAELALRHQALHDALTGLPNRTLLHDRLEHALAAAGRTGTGVGVFFCDLDGFKAVNDSAGHGAGDDLLREVAARFGACLRPGDTLARLGGDEFAVVCPDLSGPQDLGVVARRLLEALRAPVTVAAGTFNVGVSIGTHLASPGGGTGGLSGAEHALARADGAMYEAKRAGKNRVHLDDDTDVRTHRAARLLPELRTALARDELVLHGQPVVDLATGHPVAVETLVRWQHPQRGLLSPAEFLDVAEDSPLVLALGRRVLDESCRLAASWGAALGAAAPDVHVNVSGRQLESGNLSEDVLDALGRHGVAAHRLVLELTETTMPRITHSLRGDLQRLRDAGVRIAIDDLGTGYSSLARLTELPVDLLKVDLTFVAGLGRDPSCDAVVRAVLSLGSALGLSVVAEGVETAQQADLLRGHGCDTVQGYLYSRPLPEGDLLGLLRAAAAVSAHPAG